MTNLTIFIIVLANTSIFFFIPDALSPTKDNDNPNNKENIIKGKILLLDNNPLKSFTVTALTICSPTDKVEIVPSSKGIAPLTGFTIFNVINITKAASILVTIKIRRTYFNILECAKNNLTKILVIPCLSTGKGKFDKKEAASIAYSCINEYLDKFDDFFTMIILNTYNMENYNIYSQLLTD